MASPAEAGFTSDLRHQLEQGRRATLLLEQAVATLRSEELDEAPAVRAQRLRGVVVLVTTAAIEIAITSGWNEAAASAIVNDLLTERSE